MKNIFKQKKGITLIALVITIIVLLILAGISISMLTGDNSILQKATEAKINTEEKSKEEQIKIEVMGSYGTNGTIDVATLKTNLEKIGATATGDSLPLTVTLGGQEFTIDINGNVEKSVVYPTVNETLKAGDFVEYNNKPYIVLYDMDSEYNWVEIVSVNPLENVTIGKDDTTNGAQGTLNSYGRAEWSYNNAIKNLNLTAQKYLDTDLADRARCVGSNPSNPLIEGGPNSDDPMRKDIDNNYTSDYSQLIQINTAAFNDDNYDFYWLASRGALDYGSGISINSPYGLKRVNKSGNRSENNGYNSTLGIILGYDYDEFYSVTAGFRPVIRLISTIKVVDGDGSSNSLFKLQK